MSLPQRQKACRSPSCLKETAGHHVLSRYHSCWSGADPDPLSRSGDSAARPVTGARPSAYTCGQPFWGRGAGHVPCGHSRVRKEPDAAALHHFRGSLQGAGGSRSRSLCFLYGGGRRNTKKPAAPPRVGKRRQACYRRGTTLLDLPEALFMDHEAPANPLSAASWPEP